MEEKKEVTVEEFNKQILKNSKIEPLTAQNAKKGLSDIFKSFSFSSRYVLLLNLERKDITMFDFERYSFQEVKQNFITDVLECIWNRGELLDIRKAQQAIEFWIRVDDEIYCYLLFNYDEGVINYE